MLSWYLIQVFRHVLLYYSCCPSDYWYYLLSNYSLAGLSLSSNGVSCTSSSISLKSSSKSEYSVNVSSRSDSDSSGFWVGGRSMSGACSGSAASSSGSSAGILLDLLLGLLGWRCCVVLSGLLGLSVLLPLFPLVLLQSVG